MLHLFEYVVLHAACVSCDDKASIFIGDKGSGKSTKMLLHLNKYYDYISNDRIFIHLNRLNAITFLISIMIKAESTQLLPSSLIDDISNNNIHRKDHLVPRYEKIGLTPVEITKSFNVKYIYSASVQSIYILTGSNQYPEDKIIFDVLENNLYYPTDPKFKYDIFCRSMLKKS